jgi:hypothetical protein
LYHFLAEIERKNSSQLARNKQLLRWQASTRCDVVSKSRMVIFAWNTSTTLTKVSVLMEVFMDGKNNLTEVILIDTLFYTSL